MARQKEVAGLRGVAREIFAGLARSYERTLDVATLFQDRRWKDWVLEETTKGKGESFLDVGCGTLLLEEDRRTSGFTVVGVDLSRDMLGMAKTKALSNVRLLVEGDAETLPFPDCSFDCVVSLYVIKYVSRSLFIQELARVAKPGGKVVFYDFARPAGLFAPVLGFYIYGVLRLAGAL